MCIMTFFYWSVVDLQCCINLCYAAKWLHAYMYICIYVYRHISIYIYIYIYSFSYYFPLWFIIGYWIEFTVLYSRTLLFVHPVCNNLYLLIPKPQDFPPASPTLGNHTSVPSVCFYRFICVIFLIPHIIKYLSFFLWLTLLSMIISRSIHVAANGMYHFLWLSNTPLRV